MVEQGTVTDARASKNVPRRRMLITQLRERRQGGLEDQLFGIAPAHAIEYHSRGILRSTGSLIRRCNRQVVQGGRVSAGISCRMPVSGRPATFSTLAHSLPSQLSRRMPTTVDDCRTS